MASMSSKCKHCQWQPQRSSAAPPWMPATRRPTCARWLLEGLHRPPREAVQLALCLVGGHALGVVAAVLPLGQGNKVLRRKEGGREVRVRVSG